MPSLHEAPALALDSTKAAELLAWGCRLSTDEAVAWTAHWYERWLAGVTPSELRALTIDQVREHLARG